MSTCFYQFDLLSHIIGHKVNKTSHILGVVFLLVMCRLPPRAPVTEQSKVQAADDAALNVSFVLVELHMFTKAT